MKRQLFVLSAILMLAACKTPRTDESRLSSEDTIALLILMGGNKSQRSVNSGGVTDAVGSDLFEQALKMQQNLKRKGINDVAILQSSHVDYRQTDMVFFSFSETGGHRQTMSISQYISFVERTVKAYSSHKVFLIGHSYGGWLALKTALELQSQPHFKYLATIDAISRKLCFIAVPPPAACTRAPQDFSTLELSRLGQKLDWDNFYQETTSFLHSSALPMTRNNFLIRNQQHWEIDGNPIVWRRLEERVLKELTNGRGYYLPPDARLSP